MPKFTRTISDKLIRLADRVIGRVAVTAFTAMEAIRRWAAKLWVAHQQRMAERADYGPQLAALVAVLASLFGAPAWLTRLMANMFDLYLASAGRGDPDPRVGWASGQYAEQASW